MDNYEKYLKNKKHLQDNLAYDPSFEHDACGVGLVASTDGKKSRRISGSVEGLTVIKRSMIVV